MYNWRKMTETQRERVLLERKVYKRPWHAPPHFGYEGTRTFIITAACYEHRHIIGKTPDRMAECESELLNLAIALQVIIYAWCILPNHYHLLLKTDQIDTVLKALGKFHGSSSFRWNGEDNTRGRKVWFKSVERSMRSERHYYATLNYIHNNRVKHGYVALWQDWPYSSANEFLKKVGRENAKEIWERYPILDYGKEWDPD